MIFYSSPKSLLAISVRQGRQQLLVITGSPSLLLSVGKRRDLEGGRGKTCSQSRCLCLFIYIFTRDVKPHNAYQLKRKTWGFCRCGLKGGGGQGISLVNSRRSLECEAALPYSAMCRGEDKLIYKMSSAYMLVSPFWLIVLLLTYAVKLDGLVERQRCLRCCEIPDGAGTGCS